MGWTRTRSLLANAIKIDPDADVSELRALLRTERLAERIEADIAAAPPLSAGQREYLATLLRGPQHGSTGGAGA